MLRPRSRRVAAFAILFAALLLLGTARASGADWDDDDDDFDSPPAARMREARAERESAERARAPSDAAALRAARFRERQRRYANAPPMFEWRYEGVGIALVVAYVLNYFRGDSANRRIARDFESAILGDPGSPADADAPAFRREFARVGGLEGPALSGRSLLSRESPSEYKCYATGRRFVDGVAVTLALKKRNDLAHVLYDVFKPGALDPDMCYVECWFDDTVKLLSQGPGGVFAIARKAEMMTLVSEGNAGESDVAKLTHEYAPRAPSGLGRATDKDVVVRAESPEVANDLATEYACEVALGPEANAFPRGKATHLARVHCSDEMPGDRARAMRFAFTLPDEGGKEAMRAALGELVGKFVPHLIDVVGRVQVTPAARASAEKKRAARREEAARKALAANAKEAASARIDEKLAKMTDREREKWREKQAKKQLRKTQGRVMKVR
jgi:hypothetical protein